MSRLLTSSVLALSLLSVIGCSDPEATCEPACRDGFACVRGACVSACNPACAAGERCTSDARCVPADLDASESTLDATGANDAFSSTSDDAFSSTSDDAFSSTSDDAFSSASDDARSADAAVTDCAFGSVFCGGSCVTPTAPELGIRTPTVGRYGTDFFDGGDLAIDPCTGTMGLAYAQQVMGSENHEVFLVVLGPALAATPIGPIRITTAPGAANSVSIAWARDRFFVFWADPRHAGAPESCGSTCPRSLYVAAYDATGTQVLAETRLTTIDDIRLGEVVATAHPTSGEVMVAWYQSDTRQIHAAIVAPDGTMHAQQVVSAATAPRYGSSPHVVWNDGWTIFYRHDEPDGARADYFHVHVLADDGTLGPDLDLGVYGEQIALASRGTAGHVTITTGGGSGLALRLWDPSWTATTTLPITSGTYDGTRGLAFDGTNLFHTDSQLTLSVVRRNALGTETGRLALTSESGPRSASELTMTSMGDRLVLFWRHPDVVAGSTVRHRIQVVDSASAM